jgi:hypothetical protein
MSIGGALALTTIIAVASAGLVITQRRGAGWRRIVAVALLVWLAVAGVMVLWELIAAVAGHRAYFGAIQMPLATRNDATVASRSRPLVVQDHPSSRLAIDDASCGRRLI